MDISASWYMQGKRCGQPGVLPFGAAAAAAGATYELLANGSDFAVGIEIIGAPVPTADIAGDTGRHISFAQVRRQIGVVTHSDSRFFVRTAAGDAVGSMTTDPESGEFSDSFSYAASKEDTTFAVLSGTFQENYLDVNKDGRFNAEDVTELENQLSETGPPYVPDFDYSGNGEIDQADLDFLQSMIDTGLSAGIVDDLDGDGDSDWCDWLLRPTSGGNGATMGTASYRISLDENLDGLVDSAEWSAFQATAARVDFNGDGSVTSTDVSDFINAYFEEDPRTDWNGDSVINSTDVSDYNNDWFEADAC